MSIDELHAQVAGSFGRLGVRCWPDRHPGMAMPHDDDYSQVTDPERYDVVHLRARVWADTLGQLPDVEIQDLAPDLLEDFKRRYDRGVRVVCRRPDTLPLLLRERNVPLQPNASVAVLDISVVRPDMIVTTQPNCGCDACDRGSDDLLCAIDDPICQVVGGPFVVLRGKNWQAQWHPQGGSTASGTRRVGHARMMGLCRRLAAGQRVWLPSGTEAFVGRSWLD